MASHRPLMNLPISIEGLSLPDRAAQARTGASTSNGEPVVHSGNIPLGSRTRSTVSAGSGGFSINRRMPSNLSSNGDGRNEVNNQSTNQAEPRVNGVGHGEGPGDDDTADANERALADESRPHADAIVFPVPAHAWIHRGHAHSSHENENSRRVRIPDGRQSFAVVLTVRFRDAQISYSRMFASMSSMTLAPEHNIGLHEDDFEHLYRLISVRFNQLVTCLHPATQSPPQVNRNPSPSCYSVGVSLSRGGNPPRARPIETFQNYGRTPIAPEDAKFITNELEEIVLNAVKTIDDLTAYRQNKRLSANYNGQSIIPDFEVCRAFEQERKYKSRIAELETSLHNLLREMNAADLERVSLRTPADASRPVVGGQS